MCVEGCGCFPVAHRIKIVDPHYKLHSVHKCALKVDTSFQNEGLSYYVSFDLVFGSFPLSIIVVGRTKKHMKLGAHLSFRNHGDLYCHLITEQQSTNHVIHPMLPCVRRSFF